ncbi:PerC family transcriptional regulator [Escherichia coli]|nr:PerC family transcriptional regulator [Escherichia coli]
MIIDSKAEELESQGLYRRAAARWAEVMSLISSDEEREVIVKRRAKCIRKAAHRPFRLQGFGDTREAISRAHRQMGLHQPNGVAFRFYTKNKQ